MERNVIYRTQRARFAGGCVAYEIYEQNGLVYLRCVCDGIEQIYQYPQGTNPDTIRKDAENDYYFYDLDFTKLIRCK